MDNDKDLYSSISSTALNNPMFDFDMIMESSRERTRHNVEVQDRIETLYRLAHDARDPPQDVKREVEDMMLDFTGGGLETYINKPSIRTDLDGDYVTTLAERLRDVQFFNDQIEKLKNDTSQTCEKKEKLGAMVSIKSQLEEVENMKANLDRLMSALGRLKDILKNMLSNQKLNDEVRRDLIFEENMRRTCEKINNFNQFVEAKKNIERLCRASEDIKSSSGPDEDLKDVPVVISALLRDVSSVLLEDE